LNSVDKTCARLRHLNLMLLSRGLIELVRAT
jgi:hypothetical protein